MLSTTLFPFDGSIRIRLDVCFLLVCCLFVVGQTHAEENKQPTNIVLIMADDMGYECLGCNGAADYQTPYLDLLAKQGTRMTHCYSQPLCTPSRVQIMTGKYNHHNYVEFGYLRPEEKTFGHLLKQAGYRTCIAGKWQLNGLTYKMPGYADTMRPKKAGFDRSCLWQVTQPKPKGERYENPLIEVDGQVLEKQQGEYGPQLFADYVCEFIQEESAKPFFVYYPMVLVHDPFVPTPDSADWNPHKKQKSKTKYFAEMMAYTDKVVKQIDEALKQAGVRENTLLIFTADNGTHRSITTSMADGTEIRGGKGLTTMAGTHVPMVVSWPGKLKCSETMTDLIDFTDLYPTLAEVAGVDVGKEQLDGRSFLPRLLGKKGNPRDWVFCHYDPRWGKLSQHRARFAQNEAYKLYHDGRFYQLTNDVLEQMEITPSDEMTRQQKAKLQRILDQMPPWPEEAPPRGKAK